MVHVYDTWIQGGIPPQRDKYDWLKGVSAYVGCTRRPLNILRKTGFIGVLLDLEIECFERISCIFGLSYVKQIDCVIKQEQSFKVKAFVLF